MISRIRNEENIVDYQVKSIVRDLLAENGEATRIQDLTGSFKSSSDYTILGDEFGYEAVDTAFQRELSSLIERDFR